MMDKDQFDMATDRIAGECIASQVRALNRVVTRIYDDALRSLGVTSVQLNVLVAVAKLKNAQPSVLSEIIQTDASTLTRTMDRMRSNGWVSAVRALDARAIYWQLTQEGQELLERAIPVWDAVQSETTALFGAEASTNLRRLAAASVTIGKR